LIILTAFGEEHRAISSSLCSPLNSYVTSTITCPNIFLSTLFSNNLSLPSSLNVSDHVSHPYKTTGKIIVLYILLLIFLDSQWKIEDFIPNDKKDSHISIYSEFPPEWNFDFLRLFPNI
jgi:hypothetical protein